MIGIDPFVCFHEIHKPERLHEPTAEKYEAHELLHPGKPIPLGLSHKEIQAKTISKLKVILRQYQIRTSGSKEELIYRVEKLQKSW